MQLLANVTVPLFLILVGWSVISELSRHDIGELMTGPPPGPSMSVWAGTGIVAGGLIVGAIISADMTRFNRSGADVVKQTVVGPSDHGLALANVQKRLDGLLDLRQNRLRLQAYNKR